jgi:hypothetical protein
VRIHKLVRPPVANFAGVRIDGPRMHVVAQGAWLSVGLGSQRMIRLKSVRFEADGDSALGPAYFNLKVSLPGRDVQKGHSFNRLPRVAEKGEYGQRNRDTRSTETSSTN